MARKRKLDMKTLQRKLFAQGIVVDYTNIPGTNKKRILDNNDNLAELGFISKTYSYPRELELVFCGLYSKHKSMMACYINLLELAEDLRLMQQEGV